MVSSSDAWLPATVEASLLEIAGARPDRDLGQERQVRRHPAFLLQVLGRGPIEGFGVKGLHRTARSGKRLESVLKPY